MVDFIQIFTFTTQIFTMFNLFVTLPLYILTIRCISKRRRISPFDSPYFVMFAVLGVVDVLAYFSYIFRKVTYWGYVLPIFFPLGVNNFYVRLLNYFVWVFHYTQYLLNLSIQINRFFFIMFPAKSRQHFTRLKTYIYMFAIIFIAICGCIPVLNFDGVVMQTTLVIDGENITKFMGPSTKNFDQATTLNNIAKGLCYTNIVVCFIFYPTMIVRLKNLKKLSRTFKDADASFELRLFYCAFVLFLNNIMGAAYLFFREFFATNPSVGRSIEWILYIYLDFFDINNLYCTIWTSIEVRKALKQDYFDCIPIFSGTTSVISAASVVPIIRVNLVENT